MTSVPMPIWAAVADWLPTILNPLLILTGLFLILLILIQRGKGGGLAGALGGPGGSSAFGSRAGDTFTKITMYTALVWILLIMFMIKATQPTQARNERAVTAPAGGGGGGGGAPPPGGGE